MILSILIFAGFVAVGFVGLNELSKTIITDKHYWVNELDGMRVKNHNLISRSRLICKM